MSNLLLGREPQPTFSAGSRVASMKVTLRGIPNILNYCVTFIVCVYTHTHTHIYYTCGCGPHVASRQRVEYSWLN